MSQFGLSASERLKSRTSILQLFESGKSLQKYPLIFRYNLKKVESETDAGFQIAFTVPKRQFKKAVTRNLLKRRMRESFRLKAPELRSLLNQQIKRLELMVIFTGKEIAEFHDIDSAMEHLMHHTLKRI